MDRHDRQIRLPGVGVAGQARLAAAEIAIGLRGLAGEVAVRYLAGAGVGTLRVGDAGLAAAARAVDPTVRVVVDEGLAVEASGEAGAFFRDPVAGDVARGSREALRAIAALLALPAGDPRGGAS